MSSKVSRVGTKGEDRKGQTGQKSLLVSLVGPSPAAFVASHSVDGRAMISPTV
jgi:hypothetical protein